MKIPSSLSTSLLDYLDGTEDATSGSTTSVLPQGTYTKLAAAKYLKDNDKDHDGVLESDEVSISAAAYAKLDANSDGKVTQAEIANSLAGQDDAIYQFYAKGGAKSSVDLTSSLLSASNASAASNAGFAALAAKRFLAEMDKDGNALLTSNESGLSTSVFKGIDKNSDGTLSLGELKSVLASKNSAISTYYKNGGTSSLASLTSRLLKTI
jgi:Ca2+-binding EF-hand superfamily protein